MPGGARVVYRADASQNDAFELFSVPVDGSGPPVRLHDALPGGPVLGDVTAFDYEGQGDWVLYKADQHEDELFHAFAARLDGREPPRWLSHDFGSISIQDVRIGPLGKHAVYMYPHEIYSVELQGDASPVFVGGPVTPDAIYPAVIGPLVFSPDESRVVYRANFRVSTRDTQALTSARVDGSEPAFWLHPGPPAIPAGSTVRDPVFTRVLRETAPSGTGAVARRVRQRPEELVYIADHTRIRVFELYRVPSDGSAPEVRLHPPFTVTQDVTKFRLSLDGEHVVYLADTGVDDQYELFRVPLDASRPPVRRSGALPAGGDVTEFRISPDSRFAVYLADQSSDGTFELFRTPLAGPGTPQVLTPMPALRSARGDFALSDDGTQLFYRADPTTRLQNELFRVATDGLSAPVKLSGTLPSGAQVLDFALSPEQDWIVYRSDERSAGVVEIFRVPLTGGPPVAIDTMPATGDVSSFRIAPDGSFVAYSADRDIEGVEELFGAPLDGSSAPRRLSGPMVLGGNVQGDYRVLRDGRVLYRADQEVDEAFELFEGGLDRLRPSRRLR